MCVIILKQISVHYSLFIVDKFSDISQATASHLLAVIQSHVSLCIFSTQQRMAFICLARYMLLPVRPSVTLLNQSKTVEVKFRRESVMGFPPAGLQIREG